RGGRPARVLLLVLLASGAAHRSMMRVGRRCHHGGMCGRFAVTTDPKLLAEKIQAIDEAFRASGSAQTGGAGPNYNVAPTTTISTVVRRHGEPNDEPTRRVRLMRWGLVPP